MKPDLEVLNKLWSQRRGLWLL